MHLRRPARKRWVFLLALAIVFTPAARPGPAERPGDLAEMTARMLAPTFDKGDIAPARPRVDAVHREQRVKGLLDVFVAFGILLGALQSAAGWRRRFSHIGTFARDQLTSFTQLSRAPPPSLNPSL